MPTLIALLGSYVLLLALLTWYASRGETSEDFLIAGRDRPWWQVMASKFAMTLGAGWLVTYTAFAFEYGLSILTLLFGVVSSTLLFAFWAAPRIRKFASTERFYTMGDFVRQRTQSLACRAVVNTIAVYANALFVAVAFISGAKLISSLELLSYETALLLTVGVVLAYLLVAGFKAVVITDVLQAAIIVVTMIVLAGAIAVQLDVSAVSAYSFESYSTGALIGFLIFGLLATFSSPDRYQLAYAAKSTPDLVKGLALSAVPILLASLLLLAIGLSMAGLAPDLDPALVFVEAIRTFAPPAIGAVGVILFFAALMSSADTGLYIIASHAPHMREAGRLRTTRLYMLVVAALMAAIALIHRDIVDLALLTAGIAFSSALPLVYLIAGGTRPAVFLCGVFGGVLGVGLGIALFSIDPQAAGGVLAGNVVGMSAAYGYDRLFVRA